MAARKVDYVLCVLCFSATCF